MLNEQRKKQRRVSVIAGQFQKSQNMLQSCVQDIRKNINFQRSERNIPQNCQEALFAGKMDLAFSLMQRISNVWWDL